MNSVLYAIIAVLLIGYPLLWRLRGRTEREEAVRLGKRALADEMARSGKLQGDVDALRFEVEAARELATIERGKSSRYFDHMQEFERERTQWQELYWDQSIGHGSAQNLMMQTIEQLAQRLQAKGVKFKMNPILETLRQEFREHHELPAIQGRAAAREAAAAKQEAAAPSATPEA